MGRLLLFLSLACICCTVIGADKIVRSNGTVVNCNIIRVDSTHAYFKYRSAGSKSTTFIALNKIDTIIYQEKRSEKPPKPVRQKKYKLIDGVILAKNGVELPGKLIKKSIGINSISVYDSVHGVTSFNPKQIAGYKIQNETYWSVHYKEKRFDRDIDVFAIEKNNGKAILLHAFNVNEMGDYYFFKKNGEDNYFAFRKNEIVELGELPYKLFEFNDEQVFFHFFSQYFADCPIVARSVKSDFYVMANITQIFEDYNRCEP